MVSPAGDNILVARWSLADSLDRKTNKKMREMSTEVQCLITAINPPRDVLSLRRGGRWTPTTGFNGGLKISHGGG